MLDVFFPRRCPFCHEIVPVRQQTICPQCRNLVRQWYLIREPACRRCGKALESERVEYCRDCRTHKRSFDGGISVFLYGRRNVPPVKGKLPGYEMHSMGESVLRFKYYNAREYADYYIEEMLYYYGERIARWNPQVIIPVPVHPARRRKRGYNQAEVLARCLSQETGIPVCDDWLIRVRKTLPQKELNDAQRLANLRAAFCTRGPLPKEYKRVLLIDDIYTTGSTMEVCSQRLKEAGAEKIYCLSICSGQV